MPKERVSETNITSRSGEWISQWHEWHWNQHIGCHWRYASFHTYEITGLSSLGVPGVPWHTQILADQLTLNQTAGGTDYAHLITTGTPGFSDLTTVLNKVVEGLGTIY